MKLPLSLSLLVILVASVATAAEIKPPAFDFELFAKLFRDNNPAVVNISTLQASKGMNNQTRKNLGSGAFIRADGHVLTNYHVIKDEKGIAVTTADGKSYRAKVIGKDPYLDLGLLQVVADTPFPVLNLGDSSKLEIGHWVLAIGNPFGFNNTMTHGIVSARGRVISADQSHKRFDDFLQIDASINPGNSGGPLLNLSGEMVGINTATTATGSGVSFSIPINRVKGVLDDLYAYGYVRRGWLGIVASEKDLAVIGLVPGSPAAEAGIRKQDRILKIGQQSVTTLLEFSEAVTKLVPGEETLLVIERQGRTQQVSCKIRQLPETN